MTKKIHIIGGGTTFTVRPHLQLAAKAYGATARKLLSICNNAWKDESDASVHVHLTNMANAGSGALETNEDVRELLKRLVGDPETKVIFMTAALCDYTGHIMHGSIPTQSGQEMQRLKTRDGDQMMLLNPADKIIRDIRQFRKDIFLVGFKTTAGATVDDQYFAGLELLKKSSCNLVLANDIQTRLNMIITPEQARYHVTRDREEVLHGLAEMAFMRSRGKFTRSTVIPGEPISWNSPLVPDSLRTVVNYCIAKGAYKPFLGSTVGHFAVKIGENRILTSRRKTDFNNLDSVGLVLIESNGDHSVIAHGSRPSVGGQSQRIIFSDHPELDCIVHAHVPLRPGSLVPVRSQRPHECGSHECGKNTSTGLKAFESGIHAVMLEKHGPNVVFNRNTDPQAVINFIEKNFVLEGRTDDVQTPRLATISSHSREAEAL